MSRTPIPPRRRAARGAVRASLVACAAACATPPPAPEIVAAASWGSNPDPIPAARRHAIERITVHHAGVAWRQGDDPVAKLRGLQSWGKRDKGWPDVPYHYLIAPDGRVFAGRDPGFEGETNTEYDVRGHLLVHLWGNFEVQRVGREQLAAAVAVLAWACREYGVPPERIAAHRDWSKQTTCPGRDLYRYVADGSLRGWVEATLRHEPVAPEPGPALPGGPSVFVPRETPE